MTILRGSDSKMNASQPIIWQRQKRGILAQRLTNSGLGSIFKTEVRLSF